MHPFAEFARRYEELSENQVGIVTAADLRELKAQGFSLEQYLDHLVKDYNCLLHGSRRDFNDQLQPNSKGELYATDNAGIALLKSILSNHNANLRYPGVIDEKNPLVVNVYGFNPHTLGDHGFVYVVPERSLFLKKGYSWEYQSKQPVPFTMKVEALKEDFTYPIYDVDGGRRIQ